VLNILTVHLECRPNLFCTMLYCHLWPVCLYHICHIIS